MSFVPARTAPQIQPVRGAHRDLPPYRRVRPRQGSCDFNYRIGFEINGTATEIGWNSGILTINGKDRKTIGKTPRPDNVLIYYSGHNNTVSDLVKQYEEPSANASNAPILTRSAISSASSGIQGTAAGRAADAAGDLQGSAFICQKLCIETVAAEAKDSAATPCIRK
jgi:hypothetical protein